MSNLTPLPQMEEFDFAVEHRSGVKHGNADGHRVTLANLINRILKLQTSFNTRSPDNLIPTVAMTN